MAFNLFKRLNKKPTEVLHKEELSDSDLLQQLLTREENTTYKSRLKEVWSYILAIDGLRKVRFDNRRNPFYVTEDESRILNSLEEAVNYELDKQQIRHWKFRSLVGIVNKEPVIRWKRVSDGLSGYTQGDKLFDFSDLDARSSFYNEEIKLKPQIPKKTVLERANILDWGKKEWEEQARKMGIENWTFLSRVKEKIGRASCRERV